MLTEFIYIITGLCILCAGLAIYIMVERFNNTVLLREVARMQMSFYCTNGTVHDKLRALYGTLIEQIKATQSKQERRVLRQFAEVVLDEMISARLMEEGGNENDFYIRGEVA